MDLLYYSPGPIKAMQSLSSLSMSDQVSRGVITEHRARWGSVGMGVGSCDGGGGGSGVRGGG